MFISRVDTVASKKLADKLRRKYRAAALITKYRYQKSSQPVQLQSVHNTDGTNCEATDSNTDDNIPLADLRERNRTKFVCDQTSVSPQKCKVKRLRRNLPTLARACDRHRISDRAAAAIASAVLQDFGVITKDDSSNVVDRSKIRRARQAKRHSLQNGTKEAMVQSLYFDGRKDKTMTIEKNNDRFYRKVITQEHISMIEEPGSKYLGHLTPESGSAKDVKDAITSFLKDRFSFVFNVQFLSCLIL